MIKIKSAFLVFFITFLVYSPLLFNGYVGDDDFIIEKNTFYSSWQNIPRLFEKGYIINANKTLFNDKFSADLGPGSVSYRPISNLTYFLDHYLFQDKPYGSHLINILVHCVNSVLVYLIVDQIFSSSILAVFAALLFSLHPIQSEAVAVMSYRADIFAAMFVLLSFYFWIKKYYYRSWGFFGLALFSKESAVMLPLVILLFDRLLPARRDSRPKGITYAGFGLILIFYLYLYLAVFPNSSLSLHWLGGSFVNHCRIMGEIWYNFLINVFLPWTVKLIPALYCPPVGSEAVTLQITAALIILTASVLLFYRYCKEAAFFLLWYVIFYLPVSDLIPLVNPMADRFMYLPSIGILVVLTFFLSKRLSGVLCAILILVCMAQTLRLNNDWRSDYSVGRTWVRDYPEYGRGYALLGIEYYKAGYFQEAERYLEKSVQLGDRLPRENLILAECYIELKDYPPAVSLLKQIVLYYPDYADAWFFLGGVYYELKDYGQAQEMLEKGQKLDPNVPFWNLLLKKSARLAKGPF